MALRGRSLILYGFEITASNQWIDFDAAMGGPQLSAELNIGFYSLTDLMTEIVRALQAADTSNLYFATVDRTISGGTQNRVTIRSSGSFLSLLFATGTHAASSLATLIGFAASDRTGAVTYTGTATAGTAIITQREGFNYIGPSFSRKNFGCVNVSAAGVKESLTFAIQTFVKVEFMYELENNVIAYWQPFFDWATAQKPFDFTPDYQNAPTTSYSVTLESTPADGTGLAQDWTEMLPDFPFLYTTGALIMRLTS